VTIASGVNVPAFDQEGVSTVAEMVATHQPQRDEMDAYERVLGDAMAGDATLFCT